MNRLPGLIRRLISSVVAIPLILASFFWMPAAGLAALLLLLAVWGMQEYVNLLERAGMPVYRRLALTGSASLIAVPAWFMIQGAQPMAVGATLFVAGIILIAILARSLFPQQPGCTLTTAALTLFGLLYWPGLLTVWNTLLFDNHTGGFVAPIAPANRRAVIYLCLVIKLSDTGAYAIGSLWGRHKLTPRISPNKTWEGFLGGLAVGILSSVATQVRLGGPWYDMPGGWTSVAVLGGVLSLAGVLGDLTESCIKRAVNAKDSGEGLPGIGGVLDLMDSLLLAAPLLCFLRAGLLGSAAA